MRARVTVLGRSVAVLSALGVVAGALAVTPASGADVATLVQTIGGPSHAEVYPSGLEVDADGTIVVADTANNQVARYAADGTLIWRVGSYGDGAGEFDDPRDIGIDSAGNIYVADTRNSRIVKLDANGTFIDSSTGPVDKKYSFPLGVSVANDTVFVADTGRNRVVRANTSLVPVGTPITADPATDCKDISELRDADADSAGNVYVTGYLTGKMYKFAPNGTCVGAWGKIGEGIGEFRTPYGVDVALDPVTNKELVYVADGLNNRVQVFDTNDPNANNWTQEGVFGTSGAPNAPGTITTMRRVSVVKSGASAGDVYVADLWGYRVSHFARSATGFEYAGVIGQPEIAPTSGAVFHEPRGIAFAADGSMIVVDTVHHRVDQFEPDGTLRRTCGSRGTEGAAPGFFNWPRGVAVDPVTGKIFVADTKQNRVQVLTGSNTLNCGPETTFIDPDKTGSLNAFRGSGPTQFDWPYDVAIRNSDRTLWVADTQNDRVKVYNVDAPYQRLAIFGLTGGGGTVGGVARFRGPGGITVNQSTGRIFVADSGNNRIVELDAANKASTIGYVRGMNAGLNTLLDPEAVAVDAFGTFWVADSGHDRVVRVSASGALMGTIDGLAHPGNLEIGPDGRLYVADTYHDVVKVYAFTGPAAPDTTKPTSAVTFPTASVPVVAGPLTFTGTAADNVGVAKVNVAIKRKSDNLWLQSNGTWAAFKYLTGTVASPGAPTTNWSSSVTLPTAGDYFLQVQAVDTASPGNTQSPTSSVNFKVNATADAQTPKGTITTPLPGASVTSPVTLSGTASDDVAVSTVKLAIQRGGSPVTWWNGTTSSWQTAYITVNAVLANPKSTSTTWSYTLSTSAGSYGFSTAITDTSRQAATGADKPGWRNFTVQ